MQLLIKSMVFEGLYRFYLKTDEGIIYEGVSSDLAILVKRVQDLNARVIEPKFERLSESA